MKATKFIDWEERRYELAKAAMQGACARNDTPLDSFSYIDAKLCIEIANEMIKQLKESEEKK